MARQTEAWPLFAKDTTTAKLLDMDRQTFRRLVAARILPGPLVIGGEERWDVEAMQKALRGELVHDEEWTP